MTWEGLRKQALGVGRSALGKRALITLVQPGHYVLVEGVSEHGVRVWDSSGGKAVKRFHPKAEWDRLWSGVVLEAG